MVRIVNGEAYMQLIDLSVVKERTPNPLSSESFYNLGVEDLVHRSEEYVKVEHQESIDWLKTQSNWLLIEGTVPLKPEEIARDIKIYENKLSEVYGDASEEDKLKSKDYFDTFYKLLTLRRLLEERTNP